MNTFVSDNEYYNLEGHQKTFKVFKDTQEDLEKTVKAHYESLKAIL